MGRDDGRCLFGEAGAFFVTETPGLHVTVVRGIHEISYERGLIRVWTYDEFRVGAATERRVNADMLMTKEDLITMYRTVTDFLQSLQTAEIVRDRLDLVPEEVH